MPKSIKIDDSLYEKLKDFADEECRTVSQTIEYLFKCYKNGKTQPLVEEVPEKNGSVPQAKEKKEGRTLVEVKSYSQLKAERARIEADYAERIGFCQDTDSVRALYAEMNRALEPIDNQINAIFNKEEK